MSENKPATAQVKARDVVPYEWGLWCSVGDGEPFTNVIESVSWSDDKQKLWFLLGTHNFYSAGPDEMLDLVPCSPSFTLALIRQDHARVIAEKKDTCGVRGHVLINDEAPGKWEPCTLPQGHAGQHEAALGVWRWDE